MYFLLLRPLPHSYIYSLKRTYSLPSNPNIKLISWKSKLSFSLICCMFPYLYLTIFFLYFLLSPSVILYIPAHLLPVQSLCFSGSNKNVWNSQTNAKFCEGCSFVDATVINSYFLLATQIWTEPIMSNRLKGMWTPKHEQRQAQIIHQEKRSLQCWEVSP